VKSKNSGSAENRNRGAILSGVARFCNQNEGLVLPLKSCYNFWWRGAILGAKNISYLS